MNEMITKIAAELLTRFDKALSSAEKVDFDTIITIAKCLPSLREIACEKHAADEDTKLLGM